MFNSIRAEDAKVSVNCNYCGRPAKLVTSEELYGAENVHRTGKYQTTHHWTCERCGASVGCHPGTIKPFGLLADWKLRKARQRAHDAFDRLWKKKRKINSRRQAYNMLSMILGMTPGDCHISNMTLEQCEKVVVIAKNWRHYSNAI